MANPPTLRAIFNDSSDPTYEFENQCTAFVRSCPDCGARFAPLDTECPECGKPRPRCRNKAMEGEEVCRSHATGRPYSLYTKLAATLTDTALQELIEADDRDLSEEYALAKAALAGLLEKNGGNLSSKDVMAMCKDFFTIAEKKKNIEKGQVLNISWDDKMVNALRQRVRTLIRTMNDVVMEYVQDPVLQRKIITEVKNRTKLAGNAITVPENPRDYVSSEE